MPSTPETPSPGQRAWLEELRAQPQRGTLYLLDGPSTSGKSTLVRYLPAHVGGLVLLPRWTTRAPRAGEDEPEYEFVSSDRFAACEAEDGFLDCKHFLFGMSYGIRWVDVIEVLGRPLDAITISNLGNAREIKARMPEAVLVLLDSSLDTIESRLRARGRHTEEEIAERLDNAARFAAERDAYDAVVPTDGPFEDTVAQLFGVLGATSPST